MDKELIAELCLSEEVTIEYPAYNICYHYKDGREETVRESVSLKQGITAIKKFDRLICSNRSLIKDIHYIFLVPLEKPFIRPKESNT